MIVYQEINQGWEEIDLKVKDNLSKINDLFLKYAILKIFHLVTGKFVDNKGWRLCQIRVRVSLKVD